MALKFSTVCLWIFCASPIYSLHFRVIRSTTNSSLLDDSETSTEASPLNSCMTEVAENDTKLTKREVDYNLNASYPNATNEYQVDFSKLSKEFLECELSTVEPGCFEKLANGSIMVPLYERLYNDTDYFINKNGELHICTEVFDQFMDDSKFSFTIDTFSTVGIAISTVCISLYMIMFLSVKKLRNLPGYCLFSLSTALLAAYISSFISHEALSARACLAIGMVRFYFFLASFFWMNTMSYDVWRSLKMATAKLRLVRDRPMLVRFFLYSVYSWGGSLLVILIALIVDSIGKEDSKFNLKISSETCWFLKKNALLVYFALPFFILLFLNIVFFISSFIMVTSSVMKTAENQSMLRFRFLISLRLVIVMGLGWICGIIALATQLTVFFYIYTILNTLQGLFIFLSFSFTTNTMKEIKKTVKKKKSSLFTQISSMHGISSTSQKESTV